MNRKGMNPGAIIMFVLAILFLVVILTSFGGKIGNAQTTIKDTQDKFAVYKTQKSDFVTKAWMDNNRIYLSWIVNKNQQPYEMYYIYITPESENPGEKYFVGLDSGSPGFTCTGPLNERECSLYTQRYYSGNDLQLLFTSRYNILIEAYSQNGRKLGQSYTVVNFARE